MTNQNNTTEIPTKREGRDFTTRFWTKVCVVENTDICWEWQKGIASDGYGKAYNESYKQELAHRIAYRLTYGAIPDGLCVLHKCDNRKCCNPNHLFIGTHQDNMDDMVNKGRSAKGQNYKLTSSDVKIIRTRICNGDKLGDIARDFDVGKRTIIRIKNGYSWVNK